jgi:hypothetical protein
MNVLDTLPDFLNPAALEAAAEAGRLPDLLRQLQLALTQRLANRDEARFLAGLSAALRHHAGFLQRHPRCLFQCLWNSCRPGAEDQLTRAFFDAWLQEKHQDPAFRWLRARIASAKLQPALPLTFQPTQRPWRPTSGSLPQAAFSPPAGLLATGGEAGVIALRDASSGDLLEILERAEGPAKKPIPRVLALKFAPSGLNLVSSGVNGSLLVWDVRLCRLCRELPGHEGDVTSLVFSPDGARLASAGADGTARLWDADSWRCLAILEHPGPVFGLTFDPAGCRLLTAAEDGARWWDADLPGRPLKTRALPGGGKALAFSPNGRWLASAREDGLLRIWDLESNKIPLARIDCPGAAGPLWSLAWSLDDRLLAAGSTRGPIRLWDREAGSERACLRGHLNRVRVLAFSPRGVLASGSSDRTARLWDSQTGSLRHVLQHPGWVQGLTFDPDGARLTTACRDGLQRDWDSETGQLLEAYPPRPGEESFPKPKELFRMDRGDGEMVVRAGAGGALAWWPGELEAVTPSPGGPTWAALSGGEVCLLSLEGPDL